VFALCKAITTRAEAEFRLLQSRRSRNVDFRRLQAHHHAAAAFTSTDAFAAGIFAHPQARIVIVARSEYYWLVDIAIR
jgi:hypothetical protein